MSIVAAHDVGWWRERAVVVEAECARRDGVIQELRRKLEGERGRILSLEVEIERLRGVLKIYRVLREGELGRRARWLGKIAYWRKRALRRARKRHGTSER